MVRDSVCELFSCGPMSRFARVFRVEAVSLFVGCDKRSEFQGGVPARAIIEVRGRQRGSQISAPAHREPCSARLSHPTAKNSQASRELRKLSETGGIQSVETLTAFRQ
jgi:hypothetical protein